jgi:membrane-bound inhibitor of C-type lysozyme
VNRLAVLAAAALCAAGCAISTSSHPSRSQSPYRNERRTVQYFCNDGERLTVRFDPARGIAVVERGESEMELRQEPSGSGFRYGNARAEIRGQGDELIFEMGRMSSSLRCEAGG